MTAADQQGEMEKAAAEAVIAASPGFTGIESIRVELGEDWSGDPSMWVIFRVSPEWKVDESWIGGFNDYSTRLGLRLIHSGLTRFPYTRLEQAA